MGKPADGATADRSINLAQDTMAILKVLAARRGVSVTGDSPRCGRSPSAVENEVAKGNSITVP
ncbi:hypothetical protein JOF29_004425 [Kribbella aluminosa]|uniref:Uncharacterized protein n=1 Tax=Kribbella aluminosa TaxID=416017 RepID=A0ABS4UNV9_9ACTN|nr:hypothetical protein [Kribbella aluminosa]